MNLIQISPEDNVAVALSDLTEGETYKLNDIQITLRENISRGHKVALRDISSGSDIIKYGNVIARASKDIAAGCWVHTHNAKTNLSESAEYVYNHKTFSLPEVEHKTFLGYKRPNGQVGIRNEIWIIPTVGCVNSVAEKLVSENQHLVKENIDGLYTFTHPFGCSQMGGDHETTKKLLSALAKHPNAGAVLIVGLGCENLTMSQFQSALGSWNERRIKFLTCQNVPDELEEGSKLLAELAEYANEFTREEIPASELIVGLKCGGSDGLSGITANPVVGRFSDRLIAMGGSTVLTEVPEMFGAESILFRRCENEEVFGKAVAMVNSFKDYFVSHGQVVYENPSPGNKAGGITTLEDKSCGCVQKGGSAQIVDVLNYADPVTKKGLSILSGPGNDLVSATDLTATGAHIILFTTGRGTPFGAPAPTVKISTNTALYNKKNSWIDFNAGTVADDENIDDAGKRLVDFVLEIASGKKTKNEEKGFREISIFKNGVTL